MTQDLVQRIKAVNSESEAVNKRSVEAKAKRKLLLEQISEKVSAFEEEYGISFPNIDNLEEFDAFLKDLLDKEEAKLQQQVEQAEEVNDLINSGNIEEAQKLLGYKPEEVTPLKDEKVADEAEEVSEVTEEVSKVTEEDVTEEEVVEEEVAEKEEEVEEVAKPLRPRPRKRPAVKTTNFDMGVSLDDLDDVAEEEPNKDNTPKAVPEHVVEEEVEAIQRPVRRRRRLPVIEEEEIETAPKSASPIKSGGSFYFGD